MKLEDMMLSETREKDEYWVIYAEPKKKKVELMAAYIDRWLWRVVG